MASLANPLPPYRVCPPVPGQTRITAAAIAKALGGRKSGSGWIAKCPAHEDRNPSLSIASAADGRVLAHCHAGCSQTAVIHSLQAAGLWESRDNPPARIITAIYDYTDEAGNLLYQIVRYQPKDFLQRYPDGRGGWIWKKHPRQVLYRLPEVLKNQIVFLVEGEKDVETLRSHGFVATTAAGGAKVPWLPSYTGALRGREVILLPDNDKPGRLRVVTVARALLGHAAKVIILQLEGAKDVSEWFEKGHSELELIAHLEDPQVAQ